MTLLNCDSACCCSCHCIKGQDSKTKTLHILNSGLVSLQSGLEPLLQRRQESGQDVVVLQLLAEEQPLDGVVVGQQGHHVLEQESLTVGQQLGRVVHLGVDVVRHDVADVHLKMLGIFCFLIFELVKI